MKANCEKINSMIDFADVEVKLMSLSPEARKSLQEEIDKELKAYWVKEMIKMIQMIQSEPLME